jgi:hypothetical protein
VYSRSHSWTVTYRLVLSVPNRKARQPSVPETGSHFTPNARGLIMGISLSTGRLISRLSVAGVGAERPL